MSEQPTPIEVDAEDEQAAPEVQPAAPAPRASLRSTLYGRIDIPLKALDAFIAVIGVLLLVAIILAVR